MTSSRYISLQEAEPRQFTNFDTLQEILEYDSLTVSYDSKYLVASYTFDHTDPEFIKECDLVHKRLQTRYDYSPDGLQCTVTVISPYTSKGTAKNIDRLNSMIQNFANLQFLSRRDLAKNYSEPAGHLLTETSVSEEYPPGTMKDMPIEVFVNILIFSKIDDIKNLATVSKRFGTIVQVELQRNILVSPFLKNNGKFVGDGIFPNQTLVSYKSFTKNAIFLKKNLVQAIHFECPFRRLRLSYFRSLIKLLPDTVMLVSDSMNLPPISINPRMAHVHPQFNGGTLLAEQGSPLIIKISIDRNIFPGEVLFHFLQKFPYLEFISIDNFKINNPLAISEAQKLRLKFLYISGETYSDIFEVTQLDCLKCLHIEQLNLNGIFWSKLERLEGISLGFTNDKLLCALNRMPSMVVKHFTLIFREPIAEVKMFELILQFQESLSISVVNFEECLGLYSNNEAVFKSEVIRLHNANYQHVNTKQVCDYTYFRQFSGTNSFPGRQSPVDPSERLLTVFT